MTTCFLKLGGSLITDKSRDRVVRQEILVRLAGEIAAALGSTPDLRLVLGHGSGSFAHRPASRYGTRQGVKGDEGWQGFLEVWRAATELHRLVLDALQAAGAPAISFPASAGAWAEAGKLQSWDLRPLEAALNAGLLPVVYGDVAFDADWGGTILSTEDLFETLAIRLEPQFVLLAGIEPGVWQDFPVCTQTFPEIHSDTFSQDGAVITGSAVVDVTGGMESKVMQSLRLVRRHPGLQVRIFSGIAPGNVLLALKGEAVGTLIR